jgi:hypothetical protein
MIATASPAKQQSHILNEKYGEAIFSAFVISDCKLLVSVVNEDETLSVEPVIGGTSAESRARWHQYTLSSGSVCITVESGPAS